MNELLYLLLPFDVLIGHSYVLRNQQTLIVKYQSPLA